MLVLVLVLAAGCGGFKAVATTDGGANDTQAARDVESADAPGNARDADAREPRDGSIDAPDTSKDDGAPADRGSEAAPDGPAQDQAVDAKGSTGSFGARCKNYGDPCPDGETYCVAFPGDTAGFCTRPCSPTGSLCTGAPAGTVATCTWEIPTSSGGKMWFCLFVCKLGAATHPCPAWPPLGSYCSSDICHPN